MPELSGGEVLAALRARPGLDLPVIVVTARSDEADVVAALRAGADDHVVKPPKGMELLARIEAVTRRARNGRGAPIRAGRYEIDPDRRAARIDGRPVDLTLREFDLAVHLFRNAGVLLSRGDLLESVWGAPAAGDSRTVDTHVSRVRRKLALSDGAHGWKLLAIYGFGYRLVAVDPA